jgi:hypothetical protein
LQNEELYRMSVLGNTPTLANQEFARIEVSCTNLGATGNDGTIDFWASVNGTVSEFFRINGADNENNSFRPLDMNGQDIKSSTGNMVITTASSTGTGNLSATAKGSLTLASATDQVLVSNNLIMGENKSITTTTTSNPITTEIGGINGTIVIDDTINNNTATIQSGEILFTSDPAGAQVEIGQLTRGSVSLQRSVGGNIQNLDIGNDSADGGEIIWTNTVPASSLPLIIETNKSLRMKITDDLELDGNNIESVSSGISAGNYLRIKLNGTYYKIALLNDT